MLVTVGLTPAIQRVMVFDRYSPGDVNRAVQTAVCPAGKAINAARAARLFSAASPILVLSPQGALEAGGLAAALARQAIATLFEPTTTPTRTCVTVIDRSTGKVTELVEEAQALSADLIGRILESNVGPHPVRVLLGAGSLTPGCAADFYARALERFPHAAGVVDAKGPALLAAMRARTTGPRIAKLNAEEILATTGATSVADALAALHAHGATHVVVTDGARAVLASDGAETRTYAPPRVQVLNTTGCGDCLAGVFAMALAEGVAFFDAVRLGIAASAASAETLLPSEFSLPRLHQLLSGV